MNHRQIKATANDSLLRQNRPPQPATYLADGAAAHCTRDRNSSLLTNGGENHLLQPWRRFVLQVMLQAFPRPKPQTRFRQWIPSTTHDIRVHVSERG